MFVIVVGNPRLHSPLSDLLLTCFTYRFPWTILAFLLPALPRLVNLPFISYYLRSAPYFSSCLYITNLPSGTGRTMSAKMRLSGVSCSLRLQAYIAHGWLEDLSHPLQKLEFVFTSYNTQIGVSLPLSFHLPELSKTTRTETGRLEMVAGASKVEDFNAKSTISSLENPQYTALYKFPSSL